MIPKKISYFLGSETYILGRVQEIKNDEAMFIDRDMENSRRVDFETKSQTFWASIFHTSMQEPKTSLPLILHTVVGLKVGYPVKKLSHDLRVYIGSKPFKYRRKNPQRKTDRATPHPSFILYPI